jgi:hypothetical protein
MRTISAKIYTFIGDQSRGGNQYYSLRFYVPSSIKNGPYTHAIITIMKHGVRQFDKVVSLPINRFEQVSPSNNNSIRDIVLGSFSYNANTSEAALLFQAARGESSIECWATFITAEASIRQEFEYTGLPGETFKLNIIENSDIVVGTETFGNTDLGAKRSVSNDNQLPSRNLKVNSSLPNDVENIDNPVYSNQNDLNKNNLSYYEKYVSCSYYYINNSTLRILLLNLPPNFSRLKVETLKSGDFNWSSNNIKKINDLETSDASSYFFANVQGNDRETGNGFTTSGGYICFDVAIRIDQRNPISRRVNKEDQNFFSNQRTARGSLVDDNPRSNLPMFEIPLAFAGQTMKVRLRMYGELGIERLIYASDVVSTLGYSTPRVSITSNPNVVAQMNNRTSQALVMTTTSITVDNRSRYEVDISDSLATSDDIMIDLGFKVKDLQLADGLDPILQLFRDGDPILGGRQGGSFVIAHVKRYDSMTSNTVDVGVYSVDKFIDRVSDINVNTSIAAMIGAKSRTDFLDKSKERGLLVIYTIQFYEITPEMLAAYLSVSSVDDNVAARYFKNIYNNRFNASVPLIDFIKNIVSSRTPLQQSAIQIEYAKVSIQKPSINVISRQSRQAETNMPFNDIKAEFINNSGLYVPYVEVERVYQDTAFLDNPINEVSIIRESLGTLPVVNNKFAFRDFVASDIIGNKKSGMDKNVKIFYYIYIYEYVLDNGLISDKIIKRNSSFIITLNS